VEAEYKKSFHAEKRFEARITSNFAIPKKTQKNPVFGLGNFLIKA
jgi:hypothetical protein